MKHRNLYLIAKTCIILAPALSVTKAHCADFSRTFSTIRVSGIINPGDAEKFSEIANKQTKRIIITSLGGNLSESIKIAKIIQGLQLHIQVKLFCASACASVIYTAAPTRSIDANAFLAIHGGLVTTIGEAIPLFQSHHASTEEEQKIYLKNTEEISADYSKLITSLREIYSRAGVDFDRMSMAMGLASTKVSGVTVDETSRTAKIEFSSASAFDYWIPDLDALRWLNMPPSDNYVRPAMNYISSTLGVPVEKLCFASAGGECSTTIN